MGTHGCMLTHLIGYKNYFLHTCVLCHFGPMQIGKGMNHGCIGLGKHIVFRFIIEYSSLMDFYRPLGNYNNRSKYLFIYI